MTDATSSDIDRTALPPQLLEKLCCTRCGRGALECSERRFAGEGALTCLACGERVPVRGGIPRFTDTGYATGFGFQWNEHFKTQLDSHVGKPYTRDRMRLVTKWGEDLTGQTILEAGCGAGRFTEVLLQTGASLVSFDLSNAVDANMKNNGPNERLLLLQANIMKIPCRLGAFDKVFCLGVLQHTPNPRRSFENLVRYVRPGGEIAIDMYKLSWKCAFKHNYTTRLVTNKLPAPVLYKAICATAPTMLHVRRVLRERAPGGEWLKHAIPVPDCREMHPDMDEQTAIEWGILSAFDTLSPRHDRPATLKQVKRWFDDAGLVDSDVRYGPNGVVAVGRRPE